MLNNIRANFQEMGFVLFEKSQRTNEPTNDQTKQRTNEQPTSTRNRESLHVPSGGGNSFG